ncbi:MAG: glycerol-3-phosphate acyltransferase [Bacillota bacterium]
MALILLVLACYGVGSLPVGRLMGLSPALSRRFLAKGGMERLLGALLINTAKGVFVAHLGLEISQQAVTIGLFALLAGVHFPPMISWRQGNGLPAILGGMLLIYPFTFQSALALGLGTLLITRRINWVESLTMISLPVFLLIIKAPIGLVVFGLVATGMMFGRKLPGISPPEPSPFYGGDITY